MVLRLIADLTWRHPRLVLALTAGVLVAAGLFARDVEDHLKAAGFTDPASESEKASERLRAGLGYDPTPGIVLLVRDPDGGRLDLAAPQVRAEVERLRGELDNTAYISRVSPPLPAEDGRSAVISGHFETADVEDLGGVASEEASERIADSTLDVSLGGFAPSFNEVNDQTREDLTNAELIAFPALTVLLLLVFRGVIAAAIPLLIGVVSIAGTFLFLRAMAGVVDTSLFALNIATALSLGLAVDYALLMVSRYREELERDGPTREAHRRTVLTAGHAVLFSGLTVATALAALALMPQRFLYSIGAAGAAVGVLSMLVALLVVPSILRLAGSRINALSMRRRPASPAQGAERWERLARGVMARPVTVAAASAALLLAAASPLLITKLTGPSAEAVAPGLPSYETNEYVETHYPRDVTEAVVVSVEGEVPPAELEQLAARIVELEGIERGTPFERAGPGLAYSSFALPGPALEEGAQDAVRSIRGLEAGGGELRVSGNTARFLDEKQSLASNAVPVVAIVVASMLALLFALTRSVLLPIKTLLMNGLTLAATLGIIVLAFQEGWLDGPLDYIGPGAIEVTSLVFLFALTFGLATDYAVLVMARIKEAHDAGASNEDAVAIGVSRTGPVITAAALMIATVFLASAVSPIFFMKQIAVGMAVGVLLDATIVRALLVPSLMRLFGEWNWWVPTPLRRAAPRSLPSER